MLRVPVFPHELPRLAIDICPWNPRQRNEMYRGMSIQRDTNARLL